MRAEVHTVRSPGAEVVGSGDGTAGALVLANGPVLIESGGANDRRLVDLRVLVDIIVRTVTGQGAHMGHAVARVVASEVLQNVILNQRASSPAIDGEIGISVGGESAGERDVPDARSTISKSPSAWRWGEAVCLCCTY